MRLPLCLLATALCLPLGLAAANAAEVRVDIHAVSAKGVGAAIGTAQLMDADGGLKIIVNIRGGLTDGLHGFHIHQNPSCAPGQSDGKATAAAAAGGHFDPQTTGHHMGPSGDGHLGDLPVISVVDGKAMNQVLWAPRLTLAQVRGHALMIHAGGDDYRDTPKPLGGGGGRAACAVVPA
jgi:Cu-Zn family superoxide dismutase